MDLASAFPCSSIRIVEDGFNLPAANQKTKNIIYVREFTCPLR